MKQLLVLLPLLISFSVYGSEIKEMVCTEFTKEGPLRNIVNEFNIKYDATAKSLEIKFKNEKGGRQGFDKWNLLNVGFIANRVTGYSIRSVAEKSLSSPTQIIDIDFSKPRVSFTNFGGLIDFDEVVERPTTIECQRIN